MNGSPHHPVTVRYKSGASSPYLTLGRSGAATRQHPKRVHPGCLTVKPVWGEVARMRREKPALDLVRTRLSDDNPVVAAAAYHYLKAMEK
jgi:hypothetical protein